MEGAGPRQEQSYLTRDDASVCWHFLEAPRQLCLEFKRRFIHCETRPATTWLCRDLVLAHLEKHLLMIFRIILCSVAKSPKKNPPFLFLLPLHFYKNHPVYDVRTIHHPNTSSEGFPFFPDEMKMKPLCFSRSNIFGSKASPRNR